MYKCYACGRQSLGGARRDSATILSEYLNGKQTYSQLALKYRCRSLRSNIFHLFEFEHWRELDIPNTTNCLDGQFSDLKKKLRNHNGLTKERKKRLIDDYFQA